MVLKRPKPSALDLGTWFHYALEHWYGLSPKQRLGTLRELVIAAWKHDLDMGIPEQWMGEFEKLTMLAEAMADAYERQYGNDDRVSVLAIEIPLEFSFHIGNHRLKPDMVVKARDTGLYYLWENKTAGQIQFDHLSIDDQARGYASMAEIALKAQGILKPHEQLSGIIYNIIRKALPDDRQQNEKGEFLNKDGTVSKRQPAPQFKRIPVHMGSKAKEIALRRVDREVSEIVSLTNRLRAGETDPMWIQKTPHRSCPRFCDFFPICSAEEQGSNIKPMMDDLYTVEDPYAYDQDTTSERISWEM